jgi:hypothetical protein
MNDFYRLIHPPSSKMLAEWDETVKSVRIRCPINEMHARSGRRVGSLNLILPKKFHGDYIWTWYSDLLLNDRALELFRKNQFTGFEVESTRSRYKGSDLSPPRLWELRVTGWGGLANPESGIVLDEPNCCDACQFLAYK